MSRWTSWRSSNNNMAPKYPIRLSVNRGEAINFRHSSWPKCAGYLKHKHGLLSHNIKPTFVYKEDQWIKHTSFIQSHEPFILSAPPPLQITFMWLYLNVKENGDNGDRDGMISPVSAAATARLSQPTLA